MALHEAKLGFTNMVVHQQFESPADSARYPENPFEVAPHVD
jgi:hypothetical protein